MEILALQRPVSTDPTEVRNPEFPSASSADDLARANASANARALALTQPTLVDAAFQPLADPLTWTFARDGSLTALDADGRWWQACSVPLAAARAMLKTLDPQGRVACFLRPTLAAHLRVALEMLRPDQAVIAVMPDDRVLRVLMRCADFSETIASGRLWFARGEQWSDELARIFRDQPGLATPSQFVRLPITPAGEIDRLVAAAQKIFAEVNAGRAAAIGSVRENWRPAPRPRRLCVLAPSTFRLWDDAGKVLAEAMIQSLSDPDVEPLRFDPDRPASSSVLALANAVAAADALITADVARADAPAVAHPEMPWITWVTTPRVPSAQAAGPSDALLLADPAWRSAARDAGWPAEKLHVAGWPALARTAAKPAAGAGLAIVADTCRLDPPERLAEFSSHLLLWERIRSDLARDPFLVGDDPAQFLNRMMRQFGIPGEAFDRRLFVDRLIVPAFQQGVARILLRENLPIRLHGHGWDRIDEFRPHAAGVVSSSRALRSIAREAAALIHVWPGGHAHPIDALGRPVVRRRDPGGRSVVGDALRALAGQLVGNAQTAPPLTSSLVLRPLQPSA